MSKTKNTQKVIYHVKSSLVAYERGKKRKKFKKWISFMRKSLFVRVFTLNSSSPFFYANIHSLALYFMNETRKNVVDTNLIKFNIVRMLFFVGNKRLTYIG